MPDDAAKRVTALADAYVAAYFERYPEAATIQGLPDRRHDRLTDNSLAALRAWERREEEWAAELSRIDASALAGSPAWVAHGILKETLEASIAARVCRGELWGVNQLVGWQSNLAFLATVQPVGDESLRAQALARWRALPRYVDTEIANLREGVRAGYTVPRRNAELVRDQIAELASAPFESSPLGDPARRDSAPAFRAELARVVREAVVPALGRYRDYLTSEYIPAARTTIAASALPSGAACYRASVRQHSTLDIAPERVHQLGLQQIARIESEMKTIAERSFGTSDVRAVLDRLKSDPRYMFRSREEVIEQSQAALARAEREMPKWFGLVPKAKVVIERYPEFREKSAVGEYFPPSDDGTRPGTFYISTYEPTTRSRSGPESVAFHETIPGHHLQIAIAKERAGANHPIARYFGNSGYAEGWALYAERLADEMTLFSSDVDRIGMLSEQALRAARLVIDPGIHTMGWTRDQSIEYLATRTTIPRAEAESEIDRYIVWPGQATAYMLGMLEIMELRAGAEQSMGSRFDIRAFHDRVLENGAVTLPMLRAAVRRWVGR